MLTHDEIKELIQFVDNADSWLDDGVEDAMRDLCREAGIPFDKYDGKSEEPYFDLLEDIKSALKLNLKGESHE